MRSRLVAVELFCELDEPGRDVAAVGLGQRNPAISRHSRGKFFCCSVATRDEGVDFVEFPFLDEWGGSEVDSHCWYTLALKAVALHADRRLEFLLAGFGARARSFCNGADPACERYHDESGSNHALPYHNQAILSHAPRACQTRRMRMARIGCFG